MTDREPFFEKVAVVGVGLIGGSLALRMKRAGLAGSITGVGRTMENLRAALDLGIVDEITQDVEDGVEGADLVIIAVPVLKIADVVRQAAGALKPGAIVTDAGSVKGPFIEEVERLLPDGVAFVPGHPIAGTENSGAAAAFAGLYDDRVCILTPTERTPAEAVERVRRLWELAGSRVVVMDPGAHDSLLAAVSHLPHMIAYTLVNTVADSAGGKDADEVLRYSAGGFRDFTRIASSSPEMWADICSMNASRIIEMIGLFQKRLERLKALIAGGDIDGVREEFERAKGIRDSIVE